MILQDDFYLREDVLAISRELLGKVLITEIGGKRTSGIITETEAYAGVTDKASHAYGNRRTKRTETMYAEGGVAYVYLCYGIHHLFNVVTNKKDTPHAVLIRAVKPLEGEKKILSRRKRPGMTSDLCKGPGKVCQALGINLKHDQTPLNGKTIRIEERNIRVNENAIISTPRIGVDYAEEDAQLPYRFVWDK